MLAIPPDIALNKIQILHGLKNSNKDQNINVHIFQTLESTNQWLKTNDSFKSEGHEHTHTLCCAETQTHGRGRFQRNWHSPAGENMYASLRMPMTCQPAKCLGLSLVISLAVLRTLQTIIPQTNDLAIKWPNDILWNNYKLCGNLTETVRASSGQMHIIIGIGLNINSITKHHQLDQPWCSMYDIAGRFFNRNLIIAQIFSNVEKDVAHLMRHGLADFQSEWRKADYLYQKKITVCHAKGTQHGIAKGINELGQLIFEDIQLQNHYLNSGETSLRQSIF